MPAGARKFLPGAFFAATIKKIRAEVRWRKKRRDLVKRDPFLYK